MQNNDLKNTGIADTFSFIWKATSISRSDKDVIMLHERKNISKYLSYVYNATGNIFFLVCTICPFSTSISLSLWCTITFTDKAVKLQTNAENLSN